MDALREYDCGILEGRSDEAAWQQWQDLYDAWVYHQHYDQQIEEGESFQEIRQRFVPFIENLIRCNSGTPAEILCISHGGLYSVLFPLIMHNVNQAMISKYGFVYTGCIVAQYLAHCLLCVEWNGVPVEIG